MDDLPNVKQEDKLTAISALVKFIVGIYIWQMLFTSFQDSTIIGIKFKL